MAANDIHIRIDGINGESTVSNHRDEIVVESWNWGIANAAPASTGGAGSAGRATFADFTFTHRADRASPLLWKACATGQVIRTATLSVSRPGPVAQDYMTIKFTEVRVTSVALADSASDTQPPIESVSLGYAKVDYQYRPQNANGSLGAAVAFKFDLLRNRVL
jgi:type VI secretion system secreted protein Hcp